MDRAPAENETQGPADEDRTLSLSMTLRVWGNKDKSMSCRPRSWRDAGRKNVHTVKPCKPIRASLVTQHMTGQEACARKGKTRARIAMRKY